MTREEAIKILKAIRVYECYPKSASEETKEAIDMAIEALNSVTDSENGAVESKNDVIKRQDAIKTVIRMCSPICDWELEKQAYTDCVVAEINSLPSAEAVQADGDLIRRGDAAALVNRAIRSTDNKEIREYLFDGLRKQMWELPSAELRKVTQEFTQDLISREDAIKNAHFPMIDDAGYEVVRVDDILALPSAEPKTGEWIDEDGNNVPLNEDGYPLRSCYCNQCYEWLVGSDEYETKGNFCPNCGADMRGENHE